MNNVSPHRVTRVSFQERLRRDIVRVLRGRRPASSSRRAAPPPASVPGRGPRALLLWLGLILLVGLWGCENEQKIQRGVVSGYVLDTYGHRVVGARVTSHRSLYEAVTGQDGRFAFTSLDAGTHRLLVERAGYLSASRTITLEFGQVLPSVDFRLTPLPDRLSWQVFRRERTAVTIDVTSVEPMRCTITYQGEHLPAIRTPPSELGLEHRFVLSPLIPDIAYRLEVWGETADGRRYAAASGTFRPLPTGDEPGPPPAPEAVAVVQTRDGPRLTWSYTGTDPLRGFRIYRGIEDQPLTLWRDETFVFGAERSVVDEFASPGVRLRFALEAVDLDDNVSSRTAEVTIFPAGALTGDVTWRAAWSPIDLSGDLEVGAGRVFTIEPGVTVRVSPTDLAQRGYDPNTVEIVVDGVLRAGATDSAPVRFLSSSSQPGRTDWMGLRLRTPAGPWVSELIGLEVNNARAGVLINAPGLFTSDLTVRRCETGVLVQGASGTVLDGLSCQDCQTGLAAEGTTDCRVAGVTVRGGETGIRLRGNQRFTLRRFDVRGALDTGLRLEDTASASVRAGVVAASRLGVSVKGGRADVQFLTVDAPAGVLIDGGDQPDLRNCILVNRTAPGTGIGLEERIAGRAYPWNNIFGFALVTKNCTQEGAPILNTDPLFIGGTGETYDYRLQDGSVLKRAADNGGEMGAYGWTED
ncbi:MAG: hypothetical protein OZSIB_0028 [Candidatus Ozemobacter sibiricus]|uniref:Right handed beta helix domain-containing protein n=1 Tax=Candidatus Ozemobacter sibiricus TaxID=2268124 RepID=A0A367ZMN2_9BACT|nr:MAG: hypothetical protein OZSIB_0028 [Candidatus Ozemobacter sibiricus]